MNTPDEPYDVNVRQAAEILGVHENTVRNWAKSGRLPGIALPGSGFHRFRRSEVETVKKAMAEGPSYHDLHITTDAIPRTSIFNLPYSIEVTCNRVGGWEVWDSSSGNRKTWRLLGGEYNAEPAECEEGRPVQGGLRLDVAGFVIVDSLGKEAGGD